MEYKPLNDGVDHINIYSRGKTQLGRMLSNFYPLPFNHPVYGGFNTVEGFYYYVSTGFKHEVLRTLSGFEAKKFGKSLERTKLEDFENIIRKAIRLKIYQNETLKSLLKASSLPFGHYYFYGDPDGKYKLFTPKGFEYMVDEIEKVRDKVKRTNNN